MRASEKAGQTLAVLRTWALQRLARLLGRGFPVLLALVLSAAAIVDAYVHPFMRGLENRSYDLIIRNRVIAPKPDPNIVILDIDEASLAAMAEEYGRWPWPRAVLAEALDALEQQGARAVFFDILFADPDTQNPGSDALFNEAVARSAHGYYAMLRLDRERDSRSELHASQVPGAQHTPGDAGDPTLAMILPRFPAILASGRVGAVGADLDRDSVVRRFALFEPAGGWRIPSAALQIARGIGVRVPEQREMLLNWRGEPFSYRYVSFADFHADALRKHKQRDPNEFAGKIVLIGSTAPALFDLRATPMAAAHPGVEILATAIDDLLHDDYYRSLGKDLSLAVSLALVWGLAFGLRWMTRGAVTGPVMFGVQMLLLVIAYVSLNVTHYYVDLVGPVAFGLAFFVIANLRADIRERAAQAGDSRSLALERGQNYRLLVLIIRPPGRRLARRTRAWLIDAVCRSRLRARLAAPPYEGRGVLGSDFAGLVIAYWVASARDPQAQKAAAAERAQFVREAKRLERPGARFVEQEAQFEWSAERSGLVGRMLLGALQDLGRLP